MRGSLPYVREAACAFSYDHRFTLAREPDCSAPEPAGADAGDAGGSGDADNADS